MMIKAQSLLKIKRDNWQTFNNNKQEMHKEEAIFICVQMIINKNKAEEHSTVLWTKK